MTDQWRDGWGASTSMGRYQNLVPVTTSSSDAVSTYIQVFVDESRRRAFREAQAELEQTDMKYVYPSTLEEADQLMAESMRVVESGFNRVSYVSAPMDRACSITVGQLIRYCRRVWHDSELYQVGTRWRPANMTWCVGKSTSAAKKGTKGGIFISYDKVIAFQGSPDVARGVMPILAAMRLRLAPEIATRTRAFEIFYKLMNYPISSAGTITRPPQECVVSDVPSSSSWLGQERGEGNTARFEHENYVMSRVIQCLLAGYAQATSRYQGDTVFPNVRWSKEDFMSHLMTWWPLAEFKENSAYFRYSPLQMEIGGLNYYEPGTSFSIEGKSEWQGMMMPMLASLVCGIPAEIAALLPASDVFWSYVAATYGGSSLVHEHRARLKRLRDRFCGPAGGPWDQQRAELIKKGLLEGVDKIEASPMQQPSYGSRMQAEKRGEVQPTTSRVVEVSPTVKLFNSLKKQAEMSLYSWAGEGMARAWTADEIARWLTEVGKRISGTAAASWSIKRFVSHVECSSESLFGPGIVFKLGAASGRSLAVGGGWESPISAEKLLSEKFSSVGVSFHSFASIPDSAVVEASLLLVAAIASNISPLQVKNEMESVVDVFVKPVVEALERGKGDGSEFFNKKNLNEIRPFPIQLCPPCAITRTTRDGRRVEETVYWQQESELILTEGLTKKPSPDNLRTMTSWTVR